MRCEKPQMKRKKDGRVKKRNHREQTMSAILLYGRLPLWYSSVLTSLDRTCQCVLIIQSELIYFRL